MDLDEPADGQKRCDHCGGLFPVSELTHAPDAIQQEMYGDDTPYWLCEMSRLSRGEGIPVDRIKMFLG